MPDNSVTSKELAYHALADQRMRNFSSELNQRLGLAKTKEGWRKDDMAETLREFKSKSEQKSMKNNQIVAKSTYEIPWPHLPRLSLHQLYPSTIVFPGSLIKSLIGVYSTGGGKTCTMWECAMRFLLQKKLVVFVSASNALKEIIKQQFKCTQLDSAHSETLELLKYAHSEVDVKQIAKSAWSATLKSKFPLDSTDNKRTQQDCLDSDGDLRQNLTVASVQESALTLLRVMYCHTPPEEFTAFVNVFLNRITRILAAKSGSPLTVHTEPKDQITCLSGIMYLSYSEFAKLKREYGAEDIIILDEVHELIVTTDESKQFREKIVSKLHKFPGYKVGLTATPFGNSPADVFCLAEIFRERPPDPSIADGFLDTECRLPV